MPLVFIPAALRSLANQQQQVEVPGKNVGEVIEQLDQKFPGIKSRLCDGDRLRSGLQVSVGSSLATQGLRQPLQADDEVHFLPAIGGG